jgi:tetratricopeptide (TPR) repeat protein
MNREPDPLPDRLNETLFQKRPVPAVRTSYTGAWLVTAWVLCAAVGLWILLRPWVTRLLWPPPPQPPRTARLFAALAYEGISEKTNEVSPARFEEHLTALRAAGYVPIRLRDVETFYRDGTPLPEKAVLLTMDQSRKTSYFMASAPLRRLGWNAVMFLWTGPIEAEDPAALLWPYVRNMARSEIWEVGAQSHMGFQPIPASPRGRKGRFLTSPRWIAEDHRYEEPDEFLQRLRADHERCWQLIRERGGVTPIAFAYPDGDFGQHQRRLPMTSLLNTRLAAERYRLAFTLGELPFNTPLTNPYRLNRLRVRPEWTGKDLVAILERSRPRPHPAPAAAGGPDPRQWAVDWGTATVDERGALLLKATPATTGARAWLLGSDLLEETMIRLRFRLEAGQLAVHFRSSSDGDSTLCLTLGHQPGPNGQADSLNGGYGAWLCQKRPDRPRFTLASAKVTWTPGEHELQLIARDRYVTVRLDGRDLFPEPTLVRGAPNPGLVGLSVWSPQPGEASARLLLVEVGTILPATALWTPAERDEGRLSRWVARNAYRLSALSPLWLEGSSGGFSTAAPLGFFKTLASVHRLRLLPAVRLSESADLRRLSPTLLARRAVEAQAEALLLDLTPLERRAEATLPAWLHGLGMALQAERIGVVLRLPSWFNGSGWWSSLHALLPGATVAVAGDTEAGAATTVTTNMPVRIEEVPDLADEPLPPSYLIPPEWGKPMETPEEKGLRLEQEGLEAFRQGDFDRAIALWSEWRRLSPDLPRPYMLIGDALSRKGDLKGAIREFDRSLELDPGQVTLVVRRAEFYSLLGQPEKARESLNLYARLFPGHPVILRAQTRWLVENGRPAEALQLARQLLAQQPDDIESLVLVWRLTNEPAERQSWLARLTTLAIDSRYHLALGQALWTYALTAREEAAPLQAVVEQIAAQPADERIAELFGRLRRIPEPAVERFGSDSRLSARWWPEGAVLSPLGKSRGLRVRTAETHTEGTIRLLGSLRLRHTFVEAAIGQTEGSCWLFVCRMPEHFARFGLSGDGYLRLQSWRNNRLTAEKKIPFDRTDGALQLRLEARSDGLIGYVNGQPAFDGSWLSRPADLTFGWAGLAVYAPEKGRAAVELLELAGGALPLRVAVLGRQVAQTDPEVVPALELLRRDVALLQLLAPEAGALREDGSWAEEALGESAREMFKLFARYHRLWFAPLVACQSAGAVRPDALESRMAAWGADGVVLWFGPAWPDEAALTALKEAFRSSRLRVLLAGDAANGNGLRWDTAGRGEEFTDAVSGSAQKLLRTDRALSIPENVPLFLYY